jgi:hypothetical protein
VFLPHCVLAKWHMLGRLKLGCTSLEFGYSNAQLSAHMPEATFCPQIADADKGRIQVVMHWVAGVHRFWSLRRLCETFYVHGQNPKGSSSQ